jgi:hypothetical protein
MVGHARAVRVASPRTEVAEAAAKPVSAIPSFNNFFTLNVRDENINPNWRSNGLNMQFEHTILGTDPASAAATTSIPVVFVPVTISLPDGTVADPVKNMLPFDNVSVLSAIMQSPLIESVPVNVNGVNYGTTQLLDAWVRGERFSAVGAAGKYHLVLKASVGKPLQFAASSSDIVNFGSDNKANRFWDFQSSLLDSQLVNYISDPKNGITPGVIPVFVTDYNIADGQAGGYHSNIDNQIYSWVGYFLNADKDGITVPGPRDGTVLEHEMAELTDHPFPFSDNGGPCYGNGYEVGDPLEFGQADFDLLNNQGFPYHFQDLILYPWTEGTYPSTSIDKLYTLQGTYTYACAYL